jgi:hypothetical protein
MLTGILFKILLDRTSPDLLQSNKSNKPFQDGSSLYQSDFEDVIVRDQPALSADIFVQLRSGVAFDDRNEKNLLKRCLLELSKYERKVFR